MHANRTKRAAERPAEIKVSFSPAVKAAFADLAAAVHFSEHFDSGMRRELQEWAAGKELTAHSVILALPTLAGETFRHIQATGDARAQEAWDEISSQIAEKGFTLSSTPGRSK